MTGQQFVVEGTRASAGLLWQQLGAATPDRDQAIEDMAGVARVGGEQVYGPDGTSRLRVRAVGRWAR